MRRHVGIPYVSLLYRMLFLTVVSHMDMDMDMDVDRKCTELLNVHKIVSTVSSSVESQITQNLSRNVNASPLYPPRCR